MNNQYKLREIRLFNGTAPGSENLLIKEETFSEEEKLYGNKIITQNVVEPSITPFIAEKSIGCAVLIIPGGGFRRLVISKEGYDIALWLNSIGISAFVLKHRMPNDGHKNGEDVPLQDAQRAIRIIRSLSFKYGYNEDRVGVMGFSAGGHVAATLATSFNKSVYNATDEIDKISARPDFLTLMYPAISLHSYTSCGDNTPLHVQNNSKIIQKYPNDLLISKSTPETFIVVADDDKTTPSENSINFYLGLRKNNIPAELHVFKEGSHGFGLGNNKVIVNQWKNLFREWLLNLN